MNPETKQMQKKHILITFRDESVSKEFMQTYNRVIEELKK
jgi:hypothetical protein